VNLAHRFVLWIAKKLEALMFSTCEYLKL